MLSTNPFGPHSNVLVTGGAGYIGSHACKALAASGVVPITYDNLSTGHRWAVQWGPLVVGDLSDQQLLLKTLREYRVGTVFHFAASASVGDSIGDPRGYYSNNVVNTVTLLDAMLAMRVPCIVFSSSCATYGTPGRIPIREEDPQLPINPYGETKLAIERLLHWYRQAYGLRTMVLRYFNAAGADPDGTIGEVHNPETHVIPLVLNAVVRPQDHFRILGRDYQTPDGTCIRDFLHVTDLADAHVQALAYLYRGGTNTAFNLGTGHGYSVLEVITTVESVTGLPVPALVSARRLGDPPVLVADSAKAVTDLQWTPKYSDIETIIRTAWHWHQKSAKHPLNYVDEQRSQRSIDHLQSELAAEVIMKDHETV